MQRPRRPDSPASSCSRPPCTATRAGSSSRPSAPTTWARRGRSHRVRAGQPLALAPRHAARDPLPDAPRPGQARARRARPRARRRRRPAARLADVRRMGGLRARRRARASSSTSPSASATASACSPRPRTSSTSAPRTTTPRPRPGSASTTPTSASSWPRRPRAALLGPRPRRAAARRAGGLAALPLRGMSADGRYAPSPTGTLHLGNLRTALLAWLFARRGRRALPRADGGPRPGPRASPARPSASSRTCAALGLDWDGEVVFQSHRHDAYEAAIERLLAEGRLYECFCTRAEIRAAASAPHGPLPEGAYPGTCLRLTAAERRRKRDGGRPPALRVRAGGRADRVQRPRARRAGGRGRRLRRAPQRRRARLQPRGRSSTTRGRASARSCAATTCSRRPRASCSWRTRSGSTPPAYAHVPLVLGPDGSRLAKRHGAVTLRPARRRRRAALDGGDAGHGRRHDRRGDAGALRSRRAAPRGDPLARLAAHLGAERVRRCW